MFRALASFLLVISFPSFVNASAWVRPQGEWLLAENLIYFSGNQFYDRSGTRQPQNRFTKYEFNQYVEYGWRDDTTLGANLFLHYLEQEQPGASSDKAGKNLGTGENEFFLIHQLVKGENWVLSAQPLIKLPALYRDDVLPKAGSEAFDAELSALFGYSFPLFGRWHYADSRIGYRKRFDNGLNDQWRADLRLGIRLTDKLIFSPALSIIRATTIPVNQPFMQDGMTDYDLTKVELGFVYQMEKGVFMGVSGFSHIAGKNTGDGEGLMLTTGFSF